MPALRPRHFDGRCVGLGVLTTGTITAAGLVCGESVATAMAVGALAGTSFAAVSAVLPLFPAWRDEKHGAAAGGLVLAIGGVLALLAGFWLRDSL